MESGAAGSAAEFSIIGEYFTFEVDAATGVVEGVGDDCALLNPPGNTHLAVSVDTLVENIHFPKGAPADALAERLVAVNLSDLAATGADPLWATLAITLPQVDHPWLKAFSGGLRKALSRYGVSLVGGDTTRGPLTLTLQVFGSVPQGQALCRDGARPGDQIFLTGPVGDGAAGLAVIQQRLPADDSDDLDYLIGRFYQPRPCLQAGRQLRGIASACIDISDGLLADLGHICGRSGVAATVNWEQIPLSPALQCGCPEPLQQQFALSGGDDYQLCFTVPAQKVSKLKQVFAAEGLELYGIGCITDGVGVRCLQAGQRVKVDKSGYDHFKGIG